MPYWLPTSCNGYEVSDAGDIRSLDRWVPRADTGTLVFYKGQELKQQVDNCGYKRVRISVNSKKYSLKVHREVALAFIKNPDNKPQVNHLDGDKQNNTSANLEWVNNSENILHARKVGLLVSQFGASSTNFTGSVEVLNKEGIIIAVLSGNREMTDFGVDFRLVSLCLMGKRKTHKGFTFRKRTLIKRKEQNV